MNEPLTNADEYLQNIWEDRLLVFLECTRDCEPKRHFHQVQLNPWQFKVISAASVEKYIDKDPEGYEKVALNLSDQIFDAQPFEGLQSSYEA